MNSRYGHTPDPIADTLAAVAELNALLEDRDLRGALRDATADARVVVLAGEILRVSAFLEDSVSTAELGSLFDRVASTPVNVMLREIADRYGVRHSFASTTGTSALNVAAVMALCRPGTSVIVSRDCHVSIYAGLELSGACPHYVVPTFDRQRAMMLPASVGQIREALDRAPDATAVILTSPNYHGATADIDAISALCRQRGVKLMVDAAHGPHLRFLHGAGFPRGAESFDVDVVTHSIHKVMSALNQGSLAHINDDAVAERFELVQSLGFQSTSFSYPILLSVHYAVDRMLRVGPREWSAAAHRADAARDALRHLGVGVVDRDIIDGRTVVGFDPTRLTIDLRPVHRSGYAIAERLEQEGIVAEMATEELVLFLIGPVRTDDEMDDLVAAVARAIAQAPEHRSSGIGLPPSSIDTVMTPREATFDRPSVRVPIADAIGAVSAEMVGCYPPGQAVIAPGERVTTEAVTYLQRALATGGHLKRAADDGLTTLRVVVD